MLGKRADLLGTPLARYLAECLTTKRADIAAGVRIADGLLNGRRHASHLSFLNKSTMT